MNAKAFAALALATSLCVNACRSAPEPLGKGADNVPLGLMSTLPLIWGETADIGELVQRGPATGWVRQALEIRFEITPLDALDRESLSDLKDLILAQPRALSPAENVTLDDWVRGGGKLLIFADPMLTRATRFALGDPRRPQDVALLSPILARWGLALRFDETQREGDQLAIVGGTEIPVNLAGQLHLVAGRNEPCRLIGSGVLARCRVGMGSVVVLADAAVLDDGDAELLEPRKAALTYLLELAFK